MFPLYNPPPPARLDVVITEGAIREREGEVSGVEIVSVEIVRVCVCTTGSLAYADVDATGCCTRVVGKALEKIPERTRLSMFVF